MDRAMSEQRLRWQDAALVGAACLLLFMVPVFAGKSLSGHQALLAQNVREMLSGNDWLVPRLGGQPWLESPPLPLWLMAAFAKVVGNTESEWIYRLPAAFASLSIVVMVSWMSSIWFGRVLGIMSGLFLASMWQFFQHGTDPDADVYLRALVTAALAAFVHQEFCGVKQRSATFLGPRSWSLLAFFILFGLTNLVNGLFLATALVLVPLVCFLLCNRELATLRSYVWFWGLLAFGVTAAAWSVALYWSHPDITQLWDVDDAMRRSTGQVGTPLWYDALTMPWMTLPWTLPAFVGLGFTLYRAVGKRGSGERFVWCWALATPAVFLLFDRNRHGHVLHCLAPWSMLAAIGAREVWRATATAPRWLKSPWIWAATLGGSGGLVLRSFSLPGPEWLVPVLQIALPLWIFLFVAAMYYVDGRVAMGGTFALWGTLLAGATVWQSHCGDPYGPENAFLAQVRATTRDGTRYLVKFDRQQPVETARLLFYTREHGSILPNLSSLYDDRIREPEVYLLAHRSDAEELREFGEIENVIESRFAKRSNDHDNPRTLFRLTFHEDLERRSTPVKLSPMQPAGRANIH